MPTVAPEWKTIISLHSRDEYTDRLYSVHSLRVILRSHQGGSVHIIIIIIIIIVIKTIIITIIIIIMKTIIITFVFNERKRKEKWKPLTLP